jgi:hypothetical protein
MKSAFVFSSLIGTHDSASYFLNMDSKIYNINPIASDILHVFGHSNHLVYDWSKAQTCNISEQIHIGAHYLDLRVIQVDDVWYTCHGLLGNKFQYIVDDILSTDIHPVLEITTYTPPNQALCQELDRLDCIIYMTDAFCNNTLNSNLIYNTFANTPDVEKMIEYNKYQVEHYYRRDDNQLFKLSWTLTPNIFTMIHSLYNQPKTLLELASIANSKWSEFVDWMRAHNHTWPDIIIFDSPLHSV